MRVLVIGLGSMGKRRIRNLRALGVTQLAGFDPREDRRAEAVAQYSVPVFPRFEEALSAFSPEILIVSTPPDRHMDYAFLGYEKRLACFLEASVVDAKRVLDLYELASKGGPVIAPSCTMRYFPAPKKIKELVGEGAIGKPLNLNYHTGQYLRDWHPWEPIEDYYVSKRATGGCREIVPFELTWLNDVFGEPEPISCLRGRIGDLGVDIEDIYHFWLRYPQGMTATVTVEVLSRPAATREFRLLGTDGQIAYSADDNCVRICSVRSPAWRRHELERGQVQAGYINPEEPYIAEMRDFLAAVAGDKPFQNSLLDDYRVLRTLETMESRSVSL